MTAAPGKPDLVGISVLEVGGTVASAAAGAMLRRLGASVTVLDPAHASVVSGGELERLLRVLDVDKPHMSGPSLADKGWLAAVPEADVVIVDISGSPVQTDPDRLAGYLAGVSERTGTTWVTVSPYGMVGPKRHLRGTELTALAAGGLLNYMRGSDHAALKPAGYPAHAMAGHFAALAALHGLLLKRDDGATRHLDVSMQESIIVSGVFLECSHELFECEGPSGSGRYVAPRGMFRCGMGNMYIIVLEDHQWQGIVDILGRPSWAASIVTRADRVENRERIDRELEAWASSRSAAECARLLQEAGVPATPLNSAADLLEDEGMAARGFFEERGSERVPGAPVVMTDAGPRPQESGTSRPRVLDITHVLAGPLAGSWLGAMGFDVVKAEYPERPDFYRKRGPFAGGRFDLEKSAYFAAANYSKRSFRLASDFTEARAQVAELAGRADIVIENLGARGARAYGLDERLVDGADTRLGMLLSSSGWGRGVPNSGWRAYGQNIHAYGGVIDISRDNNDRPTNLGTSWADPLTAIWIAALSAAYALGAQDRRFVADLSMIEAVAYQFPQYFSWATADGELRHGTQNRLDGVLVGGAFRATDDRWVAVALENEKDWAAFARLSKADAGGSTVEREAALETFVAAGTSAQAIELLRSIGVPVELAATTSELIVDEHLAERDIFRWLEHPSWGRKRITGLPWRFAADGAVPISRTPLLGEHTEEIESEWLTMTETAVAK